MKKSLLILPIIAMLTLSGCGQTKDADDSHSSDTTQESSSGSESSSSSSSDTSSTTSSATSGGETYTVSVSPSSLTLDVYTDAEADLAGTISPSNSGYTLKWRSTNTSIVNVNQSGHVTALYKSSDTEPEVVYAFIDLNNDNQWNSNEPRGTCQVTVNDSTPDNPYVTDVTIQWSGDKFIYYGEEKTVSANVTGHKGDSDYNHKVTFSTDHPEILDLTEIPTEGTLASKVTVKGVGHGTAKLIATSVGDSSSGNKVTDEVSIEVLKDALRVTGVKSHPEKVAKGSSINPSSVILYVEMSDGSTEERVADGSVICDTSVAATHVQATASILGLEDSATFYVDVYEGHETTYQFINKAYNDNADASLSKFEAIKEANGYEGYGNNRGAQTTSGNKSSAHSKEAIKGINAVALTYSSNNSSGTIKVKVGDTSVGTINVSGTIANHKEDINLASQMDGVVSFEVDNSTGNNSIWVKSISIVCEHTLNGIAVLTKGKTSYNTGETFDLDKFVIVPSYTDGIGDISEAIDHTLLSVSNLDPLSPSDTKVTISDGTYSVDVDITVSDVMPTSLNVNLYSDSSKEHELESYSFGYDEDPLIIEIYYDAKILPTYATNKDVEISVFPTDKVTIDKEYDNITFFNINTVCSYEITFTSAADSSLTTTFTISFFDLLAPVLQEVVVSNIDTSLVKTTQYEGQTFNYSGLSFEGHYTNEGAPISVSGNDIVWATLEAGATPHGTYTDTAGTTVDVYARDGSTEIYTVLPNTLTLSFAGDMTKTTYELSDNWDVSGLTVSGEYASGDAYTGQITLSYNPATPSAMGVGTSNLTITAKAEDNVTTAEKVISVTVTGNTYTNSTGLAQGTYYICDSTNTYYLTGVSSGKGTVGNKASALEFSFTLVDDDTWEIKNGTKYLSIGDGSKTLNLVNEVKTLKIQWDTQAEGTRKIYSSSTSRAMAWYSGHSDIRTYAMSSTTDDFAMMLESNKSVASIYSISGTTNAKLNGTWSTSNITVSGYYEGEVTPKDITSLCDFTFDPATATSDDITSVNVTATLKSNPSITRTQSIDASVNTEATWKVTKTIEVGMEVVIASTNYSTVLAGIITSGSNQIGQAGAFDDTAENQAFVLTVVAGSVSGSFAFKTSSDKYLYWNSGNTLDLTTNVIDKSSWTVTIDENNNNATISNVYDPDRKLQYNAASGQERFCAYTSVQKAVQLYTK